MKTKDETIKRLGDLVYLASKVFEGRKLADLTETERQLVLELQKDGYLTKDPDEVFPTTGTAQ